MSDTQLAIQQSGYLAPVADLSTILVIHQQKKDFIEKIFREGVDFGAVPGSDKKTLLKAGAEKLSSLFGLNPVFVDVVTVEDWTGENHGGEQFFYYRQKCNLYLGDKIIASADGSCNSWEKKYRHRWVGESEVPLLWDKTRMKTRGGRISEFAFAVEKAETGGKYGKPAEYWKRFQDAINNGTATPISKKVKDGRMMEAWEIDSTLYCIPNDDVSEQVNTILKMAQKRALVAATLIATNVSDYFTQDLEDFVSESDKPVIEVKPIPTAAPVTQSEPIGTLPPLAKPEPVKRDNATVLAELGVEPEQPAPVKPWDNDLVPWEMVKAEVSSDGTKYLDITDDKLRFMMKSIVSSLGKPELTDEKKDEYLRKRLVIQAILAWRNS